MAVAKAAIPSPRPTKPSPSFVVALTATLDGTPQSAIRGPHRVPVRTDLRRLGRDRTSRWTMLPPRSDPASPRRRPGSGRRTRPASAASEGGKWLPMSPSAIAPRMASVSACNTTSASEWPTSARSCGIRTPPSMTASPGPEACTSKPVPTRCSASARRAESVGDGDVLRGDLQVCRVALDQANRDAGRFGNPASSVKPWPAARRWPSKSQENESLAASGRRKTPSRSSSRRVADRIGPLQRIRDRQRRQDAILASAADHPIDKPAETNGRTASWIRTRSGPSAQRGLKAPPDAFLRFGPPVMTGGSFGCVSTGRHKGVIVRMDDHPTSLTAGWSRKVACSAREYLTNRSCDIASAASAGPMPRPPATIKGGDAAERGNSMASSGPRSLECAAARAACPGQRFSLAPIRVWLMCRQKE